MEKYLPTCYGFDVQTCADRNGYPANVDALLMEKVGESFELVFSRMTNTHPTVSPKPLNPKPLNP